MIWWHKRRAWFGFQPKITLNRPNHNPIKRAFGFRKRLRWTVRSTNVSKCSNLPHVLTLVCANFLSPSMPSQTSGDRRSWIERRKTEFFVLLIKHSVVWADRSLLMAQNRASVVLISGRPFSIFARKFLVVRRPYPGKFDFFMLSWHLESISMYQAKNKFRSSPAVAFLECGIIRPTDRRSRTVWVFYRRIHGMISIWDYQYFEQHALQLWCQCYKFLRARALQQPNPLKSP